jgi:hypothetical protein
MCTRTRCQYLAAAKIPLPQGDAAALDNGTLERRVEDVAHKHRDVGVNAGNHRAGVKHLGTEIGELHGLHVCMRIICSYVRNMTYGYV